MEFHTTQKYAGIPLTLQILTFSAVSHVAVLIAVFISIFVRFQGRKVA